MLRTLVLNASSKLSDINFVPQSLKTDLWMRPRIQSKPWRVSWGLKPGFFLSVNLFFPHLKFKANDKIKKCFGHLV